MSQERRTADNGFLQAEVMCSAGKVNAGFTFGFRLKIRVKIPYLSSVF